MNKTTVICPSCKASLNNPNAMLFVCCPACDLITEAFDLPEGVTREMEDAAAGPNPFAAAPSCSCTHEPITRYTC